MTKEVIVYGILFLAAIGYALLLNTKKGKAFTDQYTWASVVVGVSLVLAALWFLVGQANWVWVVLAFVVAGVPMIARSLLKK